MKTRSCLLPLLSLLVFAQGSPGAEEAAKRTATLKLADGSALVGQPTALGADGNLNWEQAAVIDPLSIRRRAIVELRFTETPDREPDGDLQARVRLTNGDILFGTLDNLSATHVMLKTWYGGTLKLKRTMVSRVEIVSAKKFVYSGPADFNSWKIGDAKDAWKLESGILQSTKAGFIARELDMPPKSHLSFNVRWRNTLRFRILFFSDDGATTQPDNCYDIVCQRRFVYLRKRWMTRKSGGSRIVGQANVSALDGKEKVRLDFFFDREDGRIALYVDGSQAHVWSDQEVKVGEFGKWLQFVSEDFYPVHLSRIRLAAWDGKLPPNVPAQVALKNVNGKDFVVKRGDDSVVSGKITSTENGTMHLDSEAGLIKVPIEQVREIGFLAGEYEEPSRKRGDVRAWFPSGNRVTFRLDSFDGKSMKGHCGTCGDVEFMTDAFSRLEFNIYDETLDDLRNRK